jgi:hypothetical protein
MRAFVTPSSRLRQNGATSRQSSRKEEMQEQLELAPVTPELLDELQECWLLHKPFTVERDGRQERVDVLAYHVVGLSANASAPFLRVFFRRRG